MKVNLKYLVPCLLAGIVLAYFWAPPLVRAAVIWSADPSRGTAVFESLETAPGTIGVVADPKGQFGQVYKYSTWDDPAYAKERAESKGTVTPSGDFRVAVGGTYYIGWRALWNPMPTNGAWVALWQMHGYGPAGQGAPLVLRALNGDGNLYMQNGVNGANVNFWSTPLLLNVWNTFVVHVHLATDATGWVELWYNGKPQTFINGQTRYYCSTVDNKPGSWVEYKWGVYRSGSVNGKGPASAYMSGAKIGETYADVDPGGGVPTPDFSFTATPPSLSVMAGQSIGYTVSAAPSGGFTGNVALSATGLPSGASPSFSPTTIAGGNGSSTATISTSASTPSGTYPIVFGGASGTLSHTAGVSLTVTPPVLPDFTVSAAPASLSVVAGNQVCSTVTIAPLNGFAGTVSFSDTGLPAGATGTFTPATVTKSGTTSFCVATTASTPPATSSLTVTAASGNLSHAAALTLAVTKPGVCITVPGNATFVNTAIPTVTGLFTATFDATPSKADLGGIVALSHGAQTAYAGFANLVRFNPTGDIDARNGGAYAAASAIPFAAGATYHFRLAINVTAHTYSIYVTPPGKAEETVGLNYAFRTEQNKVTSIDHWGAYVPTTTGGTMQVCNFAIQ